MNENESFAMTMPVGSVTHNNPEKELAARSVDWLTMTSSATWQ